MRKSDERELRLSSVLIRFDNVSKEINSSLFERISVMDQEDILVHEYVFRRNVKVDTFIRRFTLDCRGRLGGELKRLADMGMRPCLHMDYFSWQLQQVQLQIGFETIRTLSEQGRAVSLVFDSKYDRTGLEVIIPHELIALLSEYGFSLET